MSLLSILEDLAYFYLLPGYKLHIVGVIWFLSLFTYTFFKFWKRDGVKDLRFFMRTCVLGFMLPYFLHKFFDLWLLFILFFGGNPGGIVVIKSTDFLSRLASDLLFFVAIYWMLSYPKWNEDFPTLQKIKVVGNIKFYAICIIILVGHLALYYTGVLGMSRATDQFTRFYMGYVPMKILWGLAYWSVWN